MEKTIDVVVPIGGQLNDLKLCISSILKHTDLNVNRLILVSDRNIGSDIRAYLDSFHQSGIYKFYSEKISALSAMVDLGKDFPEKNDILFLYPDTIVCPRWLENLAACAYSNEDIGIVFPLNNFIVETQNPVKFKGFSFKCRNTHEINSIFLLPDTIYRLLLRPVFFSKI